MGRASRVQLAQAVPRVPRVLAVPLDVQGSWAAQVHVAIKVHKDRRVLMARQAFTDLWEIRVNMGVWAAPVKQASQVYVDHLVRQAKGVTSVLPALLAFLVLLVSWTFLKVLIFSP